MASTNNLLSTGPAQSAYYQSTLASLYRAPGHKAIAEDGHGCDTPYAGDDAGRPYVISTF